MSECVDRDTLVTLSSALGADAAARLSHLASCTDCMERLARVDALRSALSHELAPRAGFVDEVMAAVPDYTRVESPVDGRVAGRLGHRVVDLANPLLATATTFVALLMVGEASLQPSLPLAAVALGAGAITLWRNKASRPSSTEEPGGA